MAAATRGLSTADLALIRETLASGRKPKVVFTESAGQVAGKVGQIIELTDPKASDDWIVVRFGRDELPFSPSDLVVPSKAPPPKPSPTKAAAGKRAEVPLEGPPLRLTEPPAGASVRGKTAPAPASGPVRGPATPVPAGEPQSSKAQSVPSPREEPRMPAANVSPAANGAAAESSGAKAADGGAPKPAEAGAPKPAKVAKPKPVASLTVTLAYTDREWTIAAQQGSKTLAKPYLIKPTEALQMVALIDMPGVHEAVEAIIDAERAEAEGRALRLREELAEIESRLAELTSKA